MAIYAEFDTDIASRRLYDTDFASTGALVQSKQPVISGWALWLHS